MTESTPTAAPPTVNARAALYGALARAQAACRTAELDGRFDGGKVKYPFTSAQERMAVARDSLGKNGLALVRKGMPRLEALTMSRELIDTSSGELSVQVYAQRMLEQDFLLTHESGEHLEVSFRWPVMEGPGRPLDKAWASADTSGLSYLLRDVLLIPSEESDDAKERDGSGGRIVQMPSRPQPPAPKPATVAAAPVVPAVAAPVQNAQPVAVAGGPPSETPVQAGSAPAAPATTSPATSTPALVPASEPDVFDAAIEGGPLEQVFLLETAGKKKLETAPLAAAKLYASRGDVQDKALWLEIFAVAERRFGSRETAIAKAKELGNPQGTVPTVAMLRKYVEVMP